MNKLCFATNNQGKLDEIKALLDDKYKILSLTDIGCHDELPETQTTIEGNSRQKAEYIWNKYKVNCFADDTGLEVYSLNGAPGVISARYAGEKCTPEDNMNLLLKNMGNITERRARFRTCITLILNGSISQFEGIVKGEILREKKGNKGFGYDPVFKPEGYNLTFAELEMKEKNKISHRGKAVKALADFLKSNAGKSSK
jgi:XTP/dITP diphosphohydrolase